MSCLKKTILCIGVIILGFLAYFWVETDYVPTIAKYQINQIIEKQDVQKIKKISANKETEKFLTSLKANDRCVDVTDFQGGTNKLGYYVATIKSKGIGIYMQRDRKLHWIWTIKMMEYY